MKDKIKCGIGVANRQKQMDNKNGRERERGRVAKDEKTDKRLYRGCDCTFAVTQRPASQKDV